MLRSWIVPPVARWMRTSPDIVLTVSAVAVSISQRPASRRTFSRTPFGVWWVAIGGSPRSGPGEAGQMVGGSRSRPPRRDGRNGPGCGRLAHDGAPRSGAVVRAERLQLGE